MKHTTVLCTFLYINKNKIYRRNLYKQQLLSSYKEFTLLTSQGDLASLLQYLSLHRRAKIVTMLRLLEKYFPRASGRKYCSICVSHRQTRKKKKKKKKVTARKHLSITHSRFDAYIRLKIYSVYSKRERLSTRNARFFQKTWIYKCSAV